MIHNQLQRKLIASVVIISTFVATDSQIKLFNNQQELQAIKNEIINIQSEIDKYRDIMGRSAENIHVNFEKFKIDLKHSLNE